MDEHMIARVVAPSAVIADVPAADVVSESLRGELESLVRHAAAAAEELPERIQTAVDDGVRTAAAGMWDNLGQIRQLVDEVVRRIGRLESGADGERHARVDELAALIDVISSGWTTLERRFTRVEALVEGIEQAAGSGGARVVYHVGDRRSPATRHESLRVSAPSRPRAVRVDDVGRRRRTRARTSDVGGFMSRILRQKAA